MTIKLLTTQYETATATFADGSTTATVTTNADGRATSPMITAGSTTGSLMLEVCASPTSCAVSDLYVANDPTAGVSIGAGSTAATVFTDPASHRGHWVRT